MALQTALLKADLLFINRIDISKGGPPMRRTVFWLLLAGFVLIALLTFVGNARADTGSTPSPQPARQTPIVTPPKIPVPPEIKNQINGFSEESKKGIKSLEMVKITGPDVGKVDETSYFVANFYPVNADFLPIEVTINTEVQTAHFTLISVSPVDIQLSWDTPGVKKVSIEMCGSKGTTCQTDETKILIEPKPPHFTFIFFEQICMKERPCILWLMTDRELTRRERDGQPIWAIILFSNDIKPKIVEIRKDGPTMIPVDIEDLDDSETSIWAQIYWVSYGQIDYPYTEIIVAPNVFNSRLTGPARK